MAYTPLIANSSGKVGGEVRKRHRASRDTASLSDNWKNRRHLNDTSLNYNVNPKDATPRRMIAEFSVRAAFASQAAWEESPVGPRYIDEIVAE